MTKQRLPEITFTKLPSNQVTTYDGVSIKRGTTIFFRFAPGPEPSAYVVVGDHSVRYDNNRRILVIGQARCIAGMNPLDFVSNVDVWKEFYNTRYRVQE